MILLITHRNSCAVIANTSASLPGSQARGQAQGNHPLRIGWRAHGALNFPFDPASAPDAVPAVWRSDCSAFILMLTGPLHRWPQLVEGFADGSVICDRKGPSGRHFVLDTNGIRHRIMVKADGEAEEPSYVLRADGSLTLRSAAVAAFHHHKDRSAQCAHARAMRPTDYQDYRLRLMLAVLDARETGAALPRSLRQVAASVLGGDPASNRAVEWKSCSQRRQIQRLLGEGMQMVEGGYRDLLNARWPVKRGGTG